MKLFDSELRVMQVLWKQGDLPAKEIARILKDETGWNKNTTYTVIKKCVAKAAIKRMEPNFLCHPLILKEEVQKEETKDLIDRLFDGSTGLLFAALLTSDDLTTEEKEQLLRLTQKFTGREHDLSES